MGETPPQSKNVEVSSSKKQRPPLPDFDKVEDHIDKLNPGNLVKSSILADYNAARAEALPITQAANHDTFMKYFRIADPGKCRIELCYFVGCNIHKHLCVVMMAVNLISL